MAFTGGAGALVQWVGGAGRGCGPAGAASVRFQQKHVFSGEGAPLNELTVTSAPPPPAFFSLILSEFETSNLIRWRPPSFYFLSALHQSPVSITTFSSSCASRGPAGGTLPWEGRARAELMGD